MKEYLCPVCNEKMKKIGEYKINDLITKVWVMCERHSGISYARIEINMQQEGHKKTVETGACS